MIKENWKFIAEIAGVIAVVASLLFVGYQLRQDRGIAQAQLAADAEIKQIELSSLISANREVWIAGLRGDQLALGDAVTFETIVHALMVKYDGIWNRAQRITARESDGIPRQLALHLYSHPGLKNVWQQRCGYYS